MKKMVLLFYLFLFPVPAVMAQEKVHAPIWNVGDKWVFTQGDIEVVAADKDSYTLNFSKSTSFLENAGFVKIVFEKPTLYRIYTLKGEKREKYTDRLRTILNFPFNPGKHWQNTYSGKVLTGPYAGRVSHDRSESFTILGWEDVQVRAGNFKAIKLEVRLKVTDTSSYWGSVEGWSRYWYSPDVKYFVKCQYDRLYFLGEKDWELASFELKK